MRKLRRTTRLTTVVIMMLVVFMTGFLLGAAPGSSGDPLVTKSWVDNYINKQCGALETRIDNLSAQIGGEICLWIGDSTVVKNGVKSQIDVPPLLINDRTVLPLRYVGETMGAKVDWYEDEQKIVYTKGGTTIELWLNKTTVKVNGKNQTIDTAPLVVKNRTLVPVRFVTENMGATVDWNETEQKVTIKY